MTLPDLAITGAAGALGGGVAMRLAQRGVPQRLIVREVDHAPSLTGAIAVAAPSYGDTAAMRRALEGARTLLLVSGRESPDRLDQHRSAVDAAVDAGVERIVYLSTLGAAPDATFTLAREHFATEAYIRKSGARHTFLRSSIYTDVVPSAVGRDMLVRAPAGSGRVAFVARADIAEVAAAVLLAGDRHDGQSLDLTGPVSLSMEETAEALSRVVKRAVEYHVESIDEAWESRRKLGAPDWMVEGWVTSFLAVARGDLDLVSDSVESITGKPARALEPYLNEHPHLWEALTV